MSHEIVNAYIFAGGEYINPLNLVEDVVWTKEGILEKLNEMWSDYEFDVTCEDMYPEPTKIRDTLEFVSEGLAQACEDACDGGMIYIVRST